MIVKCKDGAYYFNPVWANKSTTVSAVGSGEVEIWHKTKRPVNYRTLFRAANKLGLCIGVKVKKPAADVEIKRATDYPVDGEMTRTIFEDKFTDCFQASISLTSCPAPPVKFDAKLAERPADGDDLILDDWSLAAIKRRRHENSVG